MRLLDTTTLKPHEFFGSQIPHYAILSHRWGDSEVTFKDLENGDCAEMEGWAKITGCCAQAVKDGWKYAWIDSCCIDKSSSAELTEAINSMFTWYRDARVCYAYLSDALAARGGVSSPSFTMRESKWFTRGWTLQELLAPETLIFFDCNWVEIGTKAGMEPLISSITGIEHLLNFEKACIAQKMSWASKRKTLRIEDQAYCLLGLFGVNMPLLYGEGPNAFLRLQTEIIRISDDESIFAWTDNTLASSGLLARSPVAFKDSADIDLCPNTRSAPYAMTNKGLQIGLAITPLHDFYISESLERTHVLRKSLLLEYGWGKEYFIVPFQAPICCIRRGQLSPIVLSLHKIQDGYKDTQLHCRISCHKFVPFQKGTILENAQITIRVRQADNHVPINSVCAIFIHGTELRSFIGDFRSIPATFYPGQFAANRFYPSPGEGEVGSEDWFAISEGISEPKEDDGATLHLTSHSTVQLKLRSGVAIVEFEASGEVFGLEINNSCEHSPGITLILPSQNSVKPGKIMIERFNEPMREITADRAVGVFQSGALVSAVLKKRAMPYGRAMYYVELARKDSPAGFLLQQSIADGRKQSKIKAVHEQGSSASEEKVLG